MAYPNTVDEWNQAHPVGTPVWYWPGIREGAGRASVTRGPAWAICSTVWLVPLEGVAGGIALSHVEPVDPADLLRHEADLMNVRRDREVEAARRRYQAAVDEALGVVLRAQTELDGLWGNEHYDVSHVAGTWITDCGHHLDDAARSLRAVQAINTTVDLLTPLES